MQNTSIRIVILSIAVTGCSDALCREYSDSLSRVNDKRGTCAAPLTEPSSSCSSSRCEPADAAKIRDLIACFDAVAPCDPATDAAQGTFLGGRFTTDILSCLLGLGTSESMKACSAGLAATGGADAGSSTDAGPPPPPAFGIVLLNAVQPADFTLEYGLSGQSVFTDVFENLPIGTNRLATREHLFDAEPGQKVFLNVTALRNGTSLNFRDIELEVDDEHRIILLSLVANDQAQRIELEFGWEDGTREGGAGETCASGRGLCAIDGDCCGGSCCAFRCCGSGTSCDASGDVCE